MLSKNLHSRKFYTTHSEHLTVCDGFYRIWVGLQRISTLDSKNQVLKRELNLLTTDSMKILFKPMLKKFKFIGEIRQIPSKTNFKRHSNFTNITRRSITFS